MEKLVAILKSPFTIPAWLVDFLIFATIAEGLQTLVSIWFPIPLLTGGIVSAVAGIIGTAWVKWFAK